MGWSARRRRTKAAAAAVVAAAALTGCGGKDASQQASKGVGESPREQAPKPADAVFERETNLDEVREFVGRVPSTDIYVAAVLARKGESDYGIAYICDGKRVAKWLDIKNTPGTLGFESRNGDALAVTLGQRDLHGNLTLAGGQTYNVMLAQVDPNGMAGLYFSDAKVDPGLGPSERGGWIVLPDGTQRGAIKSPTLVFAGGTLDLASDTARAAERRVLVEGVESTRAIFGRGIFGRGIFGRG